MQNEAFKISICGEDSPDMAEMVSILADRRMKEKDFNEGDVDYIRKLKLKLLDGGLDIEEKDLEKLRTLCKLWDVELKPSIITSHRPLIGHLIVTLKKLIFPVIRVLLKDSFKQQRDFNAAAVSMLAELLNRKSDSKKENIN